MTMNLESVVPFGRSLGEYEKMFNLTAEDLKKATLGIADGPASFNAELTEAGGQVVSIDPLYEYDAETIFQRFEDVLDGIIEQVESTPSDWVWGYHGSPEGLRENRIHAARRFRDDYQRHRGTNRYRMGSLPNLDLADGQFDLVLCSHFLLLYSDHYDLEFHIDSIREMLRVGNETRIFPLLTLMLNKSRYIEEIQDVFSAEGCEVEIHPVEYELQRGGNEMLVIRKLANI